jgi:hypothetical protein
MYSISGSGAHDRRAKKKVKNYTNKKDKWVPSHGLELKTDEQKIKIDEK